MDDKLRRPDSPLAPDEPSFGSGRASRIGELLSSQHLSDGELDAALQAELDENPSTLPNFAPGRRHRQACSPMTLLSYDVGAISFARCAPHRRIFPHGPRNVYSAQNAPRRMSTRRSPPPRVKPGIADDESLSGRELRRGSHPVVRLKSR